MEKENKFLISTFIAIMIFFTFIGVYLFQSQNEFLELQIPIWQGERDKPYTNYIIEGTIIRHDTIDNTDYAYLHTNYGVVQVSLSFLKNENFYKKCSYNIGDKVRYAGAFSEAYRENIISKDMINITISADITTHFVLKREMC